jgi:hypothetical protein
LIYIKSVCRDCSDDPERGAVGRSGSAHVDGGFNVSGLAKDN